MHRTAKPIPPSFKKATNYNIINSLSSIMAIFHGIAETDGADPTQDLRTQRPLRIISQKNKILARKAGSNIIGSSNRTGMMA